MLSECNNTYTTNLLLRRQKQRQTLGRKEGNAHSHTIPLTGHTLYEVFLPKLTWPVAHTLGFLWEFFHPFFSSLQYYLRRDSASIPLQLNLPS